ncbi:hypothetical protein MYX76_17785, partial [Desulfobacterota bacterium AH_259_B03_O07]|nr:hypothetical protein [Desulfobacterota bacterium AH_259_B03_O07]
MNQTQNNHLRILTDRFMRLFEGRKDSWGAEHGESLRQSVEQKNYFLHLIGKTSLGIYPLLDDGTCTFGAIDIDKDDSELVRKIREELWNIGLKDVFIERSRSKGYHLWVFFSEPIKAKEIRHGLNYACGKVEESLEVFPKQGFLRDGEIGNYINLPYFGGLNNTPERRVIVDSNTFKPIPLADFLSHAERSLVAREVFYAILDELPPAPESSHQPSE